MTALQYCEKHEISNCSWCMNKPSAEEEATAERARLLAAGWITAQYGGRCSRCQEPFPPGTAITRDPTASPGYELASWLAECCSGDHR